MKILWQAFSAISVDLRMNTFEDSINRYVKKVARPDTKVDVRGVEKMHPAMLRSDYVKYLHMAQVIERVLQGEREGYDAIILGGSIDPGAVYFRELLDIPAVFFGESSFYVACLLAPKFSMIAASEATLRGQTRLVQQYGLEQRFVPGAHLGVTKYVEFVEEMGKNPKGVIDMVAKAVSKPIEQGAGAIVVGPASLSPFLSEHDVREIDGVPIVDGVAVAIKTAEMMVDLKNIGTARGKKGLDISPASKEELVAARRFYGVE